MPLHHDYPITFSRRSDTTENHGSISGNGCFPEWAECVTSRRRYLGRKIQHGFSNHTRFAQRHLFAPSELAFPSVWFVRLTEIVSGLDNSPGPPGTGKTRTLVALLNVIHVLEYQVYYESFLRYVHPLTSFRSCSGFADLRVTHGNTGRFKCRCQTPGAIPRQLIITMETLIDWT